MVLAAVALCLLMAGACLVTQDAPYVPEESGVDNIFEGEWGSVWVSWTTDLTMEAMHMLTANCKQMCHSNNSQL